MSSPEDFVVKHVKMRRRIEGAFVASMGLFPAQYELVEGEFFELGTPVPIVKELNWNQELDQYGSLIDSVSDNPNGFSDEMYADFKKKYGKVPHYNEAIQTPDDLRRELVTTFRMSYDAYKNFPERPGKTRKYKGNHTVFIYQELGNTIPNPRQVRLAILLNKMDGIQRTSREIVAAEGLISSPTVVKAKADEEVYWTMLRRLFPNK